MRDRRAGIVAALIAVDAIGAVIAIRHRVAGEPLGFGGALDVRRPLVLVFWGTGLSAPIAALAGTALAARHAPSALRVLGAMFALGALVEPVLWGRRPCPRPARALLAVHVALGAALAASGAGRPGDG